MNYIDPKGESVDYPPVDPKVPPISGDGYIPPKGGPVWVTEGRFRGWKDKWGNIWVPIPERHPNAHPSSHWDVQTAKKHGKGYTNIFPGGRERQPKPKRMGTRPKLPSSILNSR